VRKNAFLTLFIQSLLLASLLSVTIVRADVPSVIQINVEDGMILAEIRHAFPSSSHYVETIEVRIDGEVYEIDLDPQTETVFEVEIMLEDVDLTFFEVRVKCISHGWSSWASFGVEEPTHDAGGIPGVPLLSILAGVALLMLLQRRRIPAMN
jgi:hypothetical protein